MKIAICILGYDNHKRVTATMQRFAQETNIDGLNIEKYMFHVPYPKPSLDENQKETLYSAGKYGWKWCYMTNDGQDRNLMKMAQCLKDTGCGIFVPYDCDVRPDNDNWLQDTVKIFEADSKVGAVIMNTKCTDNSLQHQRLREPIAGVPVRNVVWHGGFGMTMMRMTWLLNGYKAYHSFYGGTEYAILESLKNAGLDAVMLENHDDIRYMDGQDPEYAQWKHYSLPKADAVSFEDWLDGKR